MQRDVVPEVLARYTLKAFKWASQQFKDLTKRVWRNNARDVITCGHDNSSAYDERSTSRTSSKV